MGKVYPLTKKKPGERLIESFQRAVLTMSKPKRSHVSEFEFENTEKNLAGFRDMASELATAIKKGAAKNCPALRTVALEIQKIGNGSEWNSANLLGNAFVRGLANAGLKPGREIPVRDRNPFVGLKL